MQLKIPNHNASVTLNMGTIYDILRNNAPQLLRLLLKFFPEGLRAESVTSVQTVNGDFGRFK